MKFLKTTRLYLTFGVAVVLLFNSLPAADGFSGYSLDGLGVLGLGRFGMIEQVHKEQWTIYWAYDANCPPGSRNNRVAIEEAIVWALQVWLQPIRDLKTNRPVVNDFRILFWDKKEPVPLERDLAIAIYCEYGISRASVPGDGRSPVVIMKRGTDVTRAFRHVLIHELGHTFGLGDTYLGTYPFWEINYTSRGGNPTTVGYQPSAIMAHGNHWPQWVHDSGDDTQLEGQWWITQDDVNGIVWLYKVYYENLPIDECFFPDYEPEEPPHGGCRPKYPLIFEVKHGDKGHIDNILQFEDEKESYAGSDKILRHDEEIDVNAKDGLGSTALHYAVSAPYRIERKDQPSVVKSLLAHEDIKVNVRDARARTPLHLAAKLGDADSVELFLVHKDIDVNSRDTRGYTAAFYAAQAGHTEVENRIRAHKNFDLHLHQTLPQTPADVNGDGTVNIQDLVLVSSRFGQAGENRADVNNDGAVNIQDLVLIAGAFENVDRE